MRQQTINQNTLLQWKKIDEKNWFTFAREIADLFFEIGPQQFEKLQIAATQNDLVEVRKAAHTLKSSCGNVGAEIAQNLFAQIELAASENREEHVKNLLAQAPLIFAECGTELRQFIKINQAA